MKIVLLLVIILSSTVSVFAQKGFEDWNKNYAQVNLIEVLKFEQQYADSIDAASGPSDYYTRVAKYRFTAIYLGEERKVDAGVMRSMLNVFKLFGGDPTMLQNGIKSEFLFQVDDTKFWAPIQKQLEKPLNKEVKKGSKVLLYCLFLNEHSSNGLYNTLLVSEFYK